MSNQDFSVWLYDFSLTLSCLCFRPVFARHLGHRLYRGEYFAVQSDAHVAFVLNWDDEIIGQWHTAKNEMAILTAYVSGVENHIDVKTGKRTSKARPIMCESDFEGSGKMKHLRHGQQPEGTPYIHDMPTSESLCCIACVIALLKYSQYSSLQSNPFGPQAFLSGVAIL